MCSSTGVEHASVVTADDGPVIPRRHLDAEGIALVRAQAGVVSADQLSRLGFTRGEIRRVASAWTGLGRGVYLVTELGGPVTWEATVWAGVLLGGRDACAAGPTAAILDGLLSLDEVRRGAAHLPTVSLRADREIHILTPGRQVSPRPGFAFVADMRGTHLTPRSIDPPRTRIEDTVLDLCAAGPERDVATWVSRACQRRLTTERRLRDRISERPTTRHAALLRSVLSDVSAGATTELERRVLRDVFAAHGLPAGRRQARTRSRGRIVDILLAEYALVIELDGKLGHVEEGRFRDRRRDNEHTVGGLWTLRYGWQEATGEPCACAAEIAQALRARGWTGEPTRCRRCAEWPRL